MSFSTVEIVALPPRCTLVAFVGPSLSRFLLFSLFLVPTFSSRPHSHLFDAPTHSVTCDVVEG